MLGRCSGEPPCTAEGWVPLLKGGIEQVRQDGSRRVIDFSIRDQTFPFPTSRVRYSRYSKLLVASLMDGMQSLDVNHLFTYEVRLGTNVTQGPLQTCAEECMHI